MGRDDGMFWMAIAGTLCWAVCFLWMHRISVKQNSLLVELREQAQRIEDLSRNEHELIKEVHPQVGDIKAGMDEMKATVRNTSDAVSQIAEQSAPLEISRDDSL
jgi:methyl-accepting chemotaxis protein